MHIISMDPWILSFRSLRKGCDYVDISLVDGWTLPVKLDIQGDCHWDCGSLERLKQGMSDIQAAKKVVERDAMDEYWEYMGISCDGNMSCKYHDQ